MRYQSQKVRSSTQACLQENFQRKGEVSYGRFEKETVLFI